MEMLAKGYGIIEAPVWLPDRGLLFSDVIFGGVFCLTENGDVEEVFAHRRGVGGMSVHTAGGMVVSGRNISYKPFDGGATITLLEGNEDLGLLGFNDITTDAQGRIYAGGVASSPFIDEVDLLDPGDLYMIDLDGSARKVGSGVLLSNGLGFSPDGKTLYHTDSRRDAVYCYSVNDDGTLGPKTMFVGQDSFPKGELPDGLAVSEDGAVWVAVAEEGYGLAVFNADGSLREHIEIPLPMCTSVCFGGPDLRDLYIVSGSEGVEGEKEGAIFRIRTEVAGLPVAPARVALPGS